MNGLRPMAIALVGLLLTSACASAPPPDPYERYLEALEHRMEGDSQAYFDTLIALAHESPNSRAGRRARAMLASGDFTTVVAVAGVLAAVAIPAFVKYQQRARTSEASANLKQIALVQQMFRAQNGRFCTTVAECGFPDLSGTRYVYVVAPGVAFGGERSVTDRATMLAQGEHRLRAMGMEPKMAPDGFLAAAIGNVDDDADLDIWTIDDAGQPFHVSSDIDTGQRFGL